MIAAVAAVVGVALLLRDRAQRSGVNRERSKWAALRGWRYVEFDERLLDHWGGGAVAYYQAGTARDVVIGSTFTAHGRRPVYVADSVHDGSTDFVLVAVRCRRRLDAYLELWLPSVPFQRDQMPELLGSVGQRYAFVSDVAATRSLITSDLADAAEQVGVDVNVVWLEGYWVVGAAPPSSSTARIERLLRDLGDLADLVDPIEEARGEPAAQQIPSQSSGAAQATQATQAARAAQSSTQATRPAQAGPDAAAPDQRTNIDAGDDDRRSESGSEPGADGKGTTE